MAETSAKKTVTKKAATKAKAPVKKVVAKPVVKKTAVKKAVAKAPAKKAVKKTVAKAPAKVAKAIVVPPVAEIAPVAAVAPLAVVAETPAKDANGLAEIDLQAMLEAGVHFGHKTSKWHPKMAPYIYGEEGGAHIFDLVKTAEQLEIARQYFFDLAKEGKSLIMLGTKRVARELVRKAAQDMGCFYMTARWMGGLLTNYDQLQKSIRRMDDIETGLNSGKFDKYTKYERLKLDKEKTKLERFFLGLKGLKGKPDCIFIIDPQKEKIAIKEAIAEGVKIIAIADSNADPRPLDLVIPANDDAVKSLEYIIDQLAAAYKAGRAAKK